jgi:hypothetical protein
MVLCCMAATPGLPQEPESTWVRLRSLGITEEPGLVPVFYLPSAKERALLLQKSLAVAHAWYEQQLHVKAPIVLAVVDGQTRAKIEDLRAWMNFPPRPGPRVIVMPAQLQGADQDRGILGDESILYHEDGHILADAVKIHTRNKSIQEMVAALFEIAYIRAERPDFNYRLEHFRSQLASTTTLKYSSIADFDYLAVTPLLSVKEHFWFMPRLAAVAASVTAGQSLPAIVEKLQNAFPPVAGRWHPETILSRLETTWPGFSKTAGLLAGSSILQRVTPSACQENAKDTPKNAGFSYIVVQNSTSEPISLTLPKGEKVTLLADSWNTYRVTQGESIEFVDAKCLHGTEQPTLAVIQAKTRGTWPDGVNRAK